MFGRQKKDEVDKDVEELEDEVEEEESEDEEDRSLISCKYNMMNVTRELNQKQLLRLIFLVYYDSEIETTYNIMEELINEIKNNGE